MLPTIHQRTRDDDRYTILRTASAHPVQLQHVVDYISRDSGGGADGGHLPRYQGGVQAAFDYGEVALHLSHQPTAWLKNKKKKKNVRKR